MKKVRIYAGVCVAAVLSLSVVAAVSAQDSPEASQGDTVAGIEQLAAEQRASVKSGELEATAGSGGDSTASGVVGDDGEFIECRSKRLLIEDQGAENPIAYLEGEEEQAVQMPGGVHDATDQLSASQSLMPRCGDDGGVIWREVG